MNSAGPWMLRSTWLSAAKWTIARGRCSASRRSSSGRSPMSPLHEHVARGRLRARPGSRVAGVGELVEVDDRLVARGEPVEDEIGADEAGAAGDQDHVRRPGGSGRSVQRLNAECICGFSHDGAAKARPALAGPRRDNCIMNEPHSALDALPGEPASPPLAGTDADAPSLKFSAVGLSPILQRAVADQGYTTMTPIQAQGDPGRPGRPRRDGRGPDRHRQDRRVLAAAAAARCSSTRTPACRRRAIRCARWCSRRRASWPTRSPTTSRSTPSTPSCASRWSSAAST